MNRLETGLRVFLGLVAVILLGSGFMWSFLPAGNLETYGIAVDGALGLNMIKSDIGGGLFMAGISVLMYAWKRGFWFYPAIIATLSYLVVRVVSLIADGSHPTLLFGIGLETLVAIVLLALWRMESTETA
ncbi:hypothetical protein KFU94_09340 [Chloroflexi bacterium TSY]|nr:hypothetical protein [Chloroflexi bacterium TSY]